MNKIEQELSLAIDVADEYLKGVPVVNKEWAAKNSYINLEKHCIGFAKWRMGTMYDKEKGIDGKQIIRDNPDNYWEKLFKLYIEQL